MLSCARIGAIHTLTHGGGSAINLADKLDLCDPKLIITCTAGYHNDKAEVILLPPIIDEAIKLTKKLSNKSIKKLCYKRPEISSEGLKMDDTYVDYKTLLESDEWDEEDAEMVPSGHHLYIR